LRKLQFHCAGISATIRRMETNPLPDRTDAVATVDAVMRWRKSVRAFRPNPVSRSQVEDILRAASHAPSNSNTQPWQVHVLAGEPKRALSRAVEAAFHAGNVPAFAHFPETLPHECAQRQDAFGARYYTALGIARTDAPARARQVVRNFHFFDAPVGLIFTIDEKLHKHSWLDCGLFVQSVMLAAAARGLATCAQVTFARFGPVIAQHLQLPQGRVVACGMSLGYPDAEAAVNHANMPREPLERIAVFEGL
jgi:nitroreductase